MFKNTLIFILAVLLGITSYLLYSNKNITVNLGGNESPVRDAEPVAARDESPGADDGSRDEPQPGGEAVQNEPDGEDVEQVGQDEPEIHLDPTVGLTISAEQQIVSNYKVIGPRKFSLLTKNDRTIVEIDLDTGLVNVNPEYKLDDVTKEFWKSVGRKYPEVCFVGEN